jgi:hypothetical protein
MAAIGDVSQFDWHRGRSASSETNAASDSIAYWSWVIRQNWPILQPRAFRRSDVRNDETSALSWPRAQHCKFRTSDIAGFCYSTEVSSALIGAASTTDRPGRER